MKELDKVKPLDEQAEFVMSFVEDSDETRSPLEEIWDEVEDNYLVRPPLDMRLGTAFPLDATLGQTVSGRNRSASILKDPETHQEVMTLLAATMLNVFPVGGSFVSAKGVGFEDILSAAQVQGLLEHAFRLPGHYWGKVTQLLLTLLHGTGVGRWSWRYVEEARSLTTLIPDPLTGEASRSESILMTPTWDDPHFQPIQGRNFFPDHGQELIQLMVGAAEHFKITAGEALRAAESGVFDSSPVNEAIDKRSSDLARAETDRSADDIDPGLSSHPDFMQMDAYTYYGETPFRASSSDPLAEDGIARRVITVINGVTVRSRPWPRPLPFVEMKLLPRPGSFWGVGVGEVIRYDQDFADTIKMMLADATVRMAHPPFIYNRNANVDLARLRRFNPKVPIAADSVEAVQTLRYEPRLGDAFGMYAGIKAQMRDASSALDALQGQNGPDRESATAGSLRYRAAQARPELAAQLLEREWLPQDGRLVLSLYQEMLADDSEVAKRVGASAFPASLAAILPEYDINFIGSRHHANHVQRLEAFREIATVASNPLVAPLIPWIPLLRKWFKEQGEEEIAAMVGNPKLVQLHMLITQLGGGGASPEQQPTAATPPGLAPAQAAGITG